MQYINRLAELYNLSIVSEDLGICNADPSRLNEFIDIFLKHEAKDSREWDELIDLVFQSAEDAINIGSHT